ncbi:MAG TPA: HDOD domain-containing protein [Verrucomicrobiae bacterium]|nr:HDOD domain-containing protein [Verrucomicrobiae bacterium]
MTPSPIASLDVGVLPTMPRVAIRVRELVAASNTSVADVVKILSLDQTMAATVLKVSNSAAFAVRGGVTSLSQAIVVMGFRTLQSVVTAACTASLHHKASASFKDQVLWDHSLAAGLAGSRIARECGYVKVEDAFLAGLMHDIGKLVLDFNRRESYAKVVERVYNEDVTFLRAEREELGFDHTAVAARIAEVWKLPAELVEAVRQHHEPAAATVDPALCAIVSLANSLCVKLCIGPERHPDLDLGQLEPAATLAITPAQLEAIGAELPELLAKEKSLFR